MADKWTAKDVAEHFEEAIYTLKKLPAVRVQGYFNLWPDMKYSPNEIMQMEPMPMRRATHWMLLPVSSKPSTGCNGLTWKSAN